MQDARAIYHRRIGALHLVIWVGHVRDRVDQRDLVFAGAQDIEPAGDGFRGAAVAAAGVGVK